MLTQEKDIADPQLRQQLDARGKKFDEAYNDNDATAVAALFTEDGVFVTDKGPIYGRKAIEKYYTDRFQEWRFSRLPSNPWVAFVFVSRHGGSWSLRDPQAGR
jgi:hypothetical protein